MTREEIHHDYLLAYEMVAPLKAKIRILTQLFICYPDAWRVVGITRDAINVFKESEFRYRNGMGIQRAHVIDRSETYRQMLTRRMDIKEFWALFIENDKTVLATKAENKLSHRLEGWIPIDDTLGLFKLNGYGWRHRSEESTYLRRLYEARSEDLSQLDVDGWDKPGYDGLTENVCLSRE